MSKFMVTFFERCEDVDDQNQQAGQPYCAQARQLWPGGSSIPQGSITAVETRLSCVSQFAHGQSV